MNLFHDYGLTFANPWLLWLLLAVPLLAWLRGQRGGLPAVVFSSITPLRSLGRAAESRAGNFFTSLIFLALVEDGTAIGSAIASGCSRLRDKESKSKVIILLTDGDNNAGKVAPETAAEAAKALGVKLHAIGAGTNGVAPVPVFGQNGQPA